MKELLRKIYPLKLAPNSEDTDKAARILETILPFRIHEYEAGREHNGWTVPHKWKAVKAEIRKDGKLIYDGMHHPLGVASYSTSFKGKVGLDEIKKHLFYHPVFEESLVYHCDYFYKPWLRDWGLTLPKTVFDSLEDGEYDVDIETVFEEGTMKVLDFELKGETDETVILNAHNCHAAQANDDVAGIVVGIEVMKRLMKMERRRYTYRLVIAPEHLGTVFYLADLPEEESAKFKQAIFLEMLGNRNDLALQESFTGKSLIDRAFAQHLESSHETFRRYPFRGLVGNDETVWEAPGFQIPCISLSRFPYDEYHSDRDNEEIIHSDMLEEAVEAVIGAFEIMENNLVMERKFKGLVALSNPKYDLYISTIDPSIRRKVDDLQLKWNNMMNYLPRYFDGKTTVLEIAEKHEIPFADLFTYLKKFEEKGLIEFHGVKND